jgi:hypothetical protein
MSGDPLVVAHGVHQGTALGACHNGASVPTSFGIAIGVSPLAGSPAPGDAAGAATDRR